MIELEQNGFSKNEDGEYILDNWTLRLDCDNFEIFTDPEIDTRYYYGSLDNLNIILEDILYDTRK